MTWSIVQHRVYKRHYGSLKRQIILVDSKVLVEVVDDRLKTRAFGIILLKVQHGFEDFAMATRNEANGAEDFQDGYFCFYVFRG